MQQTVSDKKPIEELFTTHKREHRQVKSRHACHTFTKLPTWICDVADQKGTVKVEQLN